MATLAQVQDRIFEREGFRVALVPFKENERRFPAYEYPVMASNKWRISDWKQARLVLYVAQIRAVTIFKGDGTPVRTDMKLANLRDSYFEALCASEEPAPAPAHDNVLAFPRPPDQRRARGSKRP